MSDDLWDELQHMILRRDDPELCIPYTTYVGVLARNRLSLIGRPLNSSDQHLRTLIFTLPRVWRLSYRVHGRILDDRYVQFLVQTEVDLVAVLRKGPWLFNQWFIALQRWMDFPDEEFITFIDIWVQVRGIPLPYVSELTVRFIASTLGHVVDLDFNEATTIQIVFIRVKIKFGISDRLPSLEEFVLNQGKGL